MTSTLSGTNNTFSGTQKLREGNTHLQETVLLKGNPTTQKYGHLEIGEDRPWSVTSLAP